MNLPGLDSPRRDPAAASRVRSWVSDTIGSAAEDCTIVVAELACSELGCPPVETVIGLLRAGDQTQCKIHKPLAEVTASDVVAVLEGRHHHDPGVIGVDLPT